MIDIFTAGQGLLTSGLAWGINNTLKQGDYIDTYSISCYKESYVGSSTITDYKTSLGVKFSHYIYNNPLKITLNNVMLEKLFTLENNNNLNNLGLNIFVCEFLRMQQRLGIPLFLRVSNFIGLVILESFSYSVSQGLYSDFNLTFRQYQIYMPTEVEGTTGVLANKIALPNTVNGG
jgi:hypothetical protein